MIEVSRLKDLNASKLFLGFCIGAIGRRDFAVFPVQGQRGLRRLKRYFGDKLSVGAQMVVVLKAFVERCVSLVLGHPFEFPWLEVSQTDVFHCSSPPGGNQQHSLARFVHPISRRAQEKSTAEAKYFYFRKLGTGELGGTGDRPVVHQSPFVRKTGKRSFCGRFSARVALGGSEPTRLSNEVAGDHPSAPGPSHLKVSHIFLYSSSLLIASLRVRSRIRWKVQRACAAIPRTNSVSRDSL